MERPYPVMDERRLPAVPRKFWGSARRPLTDLPAAGPGTALVLHVGGRCIAVTEGNRLTGAEEALLEATSVSLVDLRPRTFGVELNVPSADPADTFDIHVVFQARVDRAEIAAECGAIDLAAELRRYVRRDGKLLKIGSDYRVHEIAEVRELVEARVEAYCELLPYEGAPGVSVAFRLAEVGTPNKLREHAVTIRDEVWQQELANLRNLGEDVSVARLKALVEQGAPALTALGLARGEYGLGDAVREARSDEDAARRHLIEVLRIMDVDFVTVDTQRIVDSLLHQITRSAVDPGHSRPLARGTEASALTGGRPRKENDENPPDESDLYD
ncbi:hypothetical protein [Kitasatospora paranensis]|uniref:Band 7 domain-containing protein n=1 Tax=Kitasatospora paranensis TaxID=258053 RepID=A0ABW2G4B7_9ACTN